MEFVGEIERSEHFPIYVETEVEIIESFLKKWFSCHLKYVFNL